MQEMEGGEFFDRVAEVMSHSQWHVEHPKGGFANSLPRKHFTSLWLNLHNHLPTGILLERDTEVEVVERGQEGG